MNSIIVDSLNEDNIIKISVILCDSYSNDDVCASEESKESIEEKTLCFSRFSFSLSVLKSTLSIKLGIRQRGMRLFTFYGIECFEDSDLYLFLSNYNFENVVFVTENNLNFDSKFILKSFTLIKKLGQGGFGNVYLAKSKISGELFALKYIYSDYCHSNMIDFVYKEIDALKNIEHPNIIKLYNYCVLSNQLVLILEYAKGGTLREYLVSKTHLSESEARNVIKQLVEGLTFCHNRKIVHRDIKPENLVFTDLERSSLKIIDFGLASILLGERLKGGSLRYMAPEILGKYDTRSLPSVDIWAVGCILYELITGSYAFQGKAEQLKKNILKGSMKINAAMSLEALHLLSQLLKMDNKERIKFYDIPNHVWMKKEKFNEKDKDLNSWKESTRMYKIYAELQESIREEEDRIVANPMSPGVHNGDVESNCLLPKINGTKLLDEKPKLSRNNHPHGVSPLYVTNSNRSPRVRKFKQNYLEEKKEAVANAKAKAIANIKDSKEVLKSKEDLLMRKLSINSYEKKDYPNLESERDQNQGRSKSIKITSIAKIEDKNMRLFSPTLSQKVNEDLKRSSKQHDTVSVVLQTGHTGEYRVNNDDIFFLLDKTPLKLQQLKKKSNGIKRTNSISILASKVSNVVSSNQFSSATNNTSSIKSGMDLIRIGDEKDKKQKDKVLFIF